jgi:hypothetical protein
MPMYASAPGPIAAQNQLPGNMGVGIKSEATAKIEKKANIINPLMYIQTPYSTYERVINQ